MFEIKGRIRESLNFHWKYNRMIFIKVVIITICFIIAILVFLFSGNEGTEVVISDSDDIAKDYKEEVIVPEEPILMYVDVAGAVTSPGVIQIEEGARVFQAIEKAGGLKANADTTNVNLASELHDGDKIFIPTVQEVKTNKNAGGIITSKVTSNVRTEDNSLVNINTATSEQLQTLSGVGPSTAQKIIDYREKYGGFKDINDILNVSGIGEKTLNKFKDKLCV